MKMAAHGAESSSGWEERRGFPIQGVPAESRQGESPSPAGGSGDDLGDAARIVDALKASADQEFQIAERLSSKARQAFALAAGVFVIAQTVVFGNFASKNLSDNEKHWMITLAIGAVVALAFAALCTLKAD